MVEDPHIGYDFLIKERFFLRACLWVLRGPRLDAFKAFSQVILQTSKTAEGHVQQDRYGRSEVPLQAGLSYLCIYAKKKRRREIQRREVTACTKQAALNLLPKLVCNCLHHYKYLSTFFTSLDIHQGKSLAITCRYTWDIGSHAPSAFSRMA